MSEIQTIRDELVPDEEAPQGFTIDNMGKAEWAMSKIARAESRIKERAAMATKLISQIALRLDEITKNDKQTVGYLSALIRPWAEVEIAKAGKRKSLPLLGGVVGFRQSPERLEVIDEKAAIEWLEDNGGAFVRVKKEIDKNAVKQSIKETGLVPDGVQLVQGDIRFYVEAAPLEIEKKEA